MRQKATDAELLSSIKDVGFAQTASRFGLTKRQVHSRRRQIESKTGEAIESPILRGGILRQSQAYPHRIPLEIRDGIVIVAGDAHYWPGKPSLMHRALVSFIKRFRDERRLKAVVMNGDATDLASVSRWPQVNWEKRPTVQEEIEVCTDRMHELAEASGRVPKLWPLGNHDARFSMRLAEKAPEYAKVHGMHLKDHFPLWEACWSVEINGHTIIKHRYKGGDHATHNNAMRAGVNMVTNHLHSAKVTAYTDYRGTRWGVDTGCIADVSGPQFLYLEDNPRNWREGFAVLTFADGELLPPELVLRCEHKENAVVFRGEIIEV